MRSGCLRRALFGRRIDSWRSIFSGVFSPTELSTVKCVVLPAGTDAASAELMQSESLAQFLQWLEGQWLVGVLEARRLMSVFQPIVHTDDPQNIYAYECLLRGRTANGQWIMPDRLFAAARMPACSNGWIPPPATPPCNRPRSTTCRRPCLSISIRMRSSISKVF